MHDPKKISFLYLSAFSTKGGIERFNQAFIYALNKNTEKVTLFSLYDKLEDLDVRYSNNANFSGFFKFRVLTAINILIKMLLSKADVLFVGHLNLASLALVIQAFRPTTRIILIGHGIDVWDQSSFIKKRFLDNVNQIWTVSSFTRDRMIEEYGLTPDKFRLFPNTLDPYIDFSTKKQQFSSLKDRYAIQEDTKVVLTVCRISSSEAYKGYDRVVKALSLLKTQNVCYLLAGKYDEIEKKRVLGIAKKYKVADKLIFTSFIPDEELTAHYKLADVFIMPSVNEGFGIVFLEAIACGVRVIAGNKDGSKDALANGELGLLINPLSEEEIANALDQVFSEQVVDESLSKRMLDKFGMEAFVERQKKYIEEG